MIFPLIRVYSMSVSNSNITEEEIQRFAKEVIDVKKEEIIKKHIEAQNFIHAAMIELGLYQVYGFKDSDVISQGWSPADLKLRDIAGIHAEYKKITFYAPNKRSMVIAITLKNSKEIDKSTWRKCERLVNFFKKIYEMENELTKLRRIKDEVEWLRKENEELKNELKKLREVEEDYKSLRRRIHDIENKYELAREFIDYQGLGKKFIRYVIGVQSIVAEWVKRDFRLVDDEEDDP